MHAVKNSTLGKVVTGVIAFAFAFSVYTPSVDAQTSEELQSQIASLLAQIAALQGQLGTQGGTTTTSGLYCNFSFLRDLSSGSTGSDVMDLQKFLNSVPGITVAASGAGSPGMETTYYGPATASAVSAFQVQYSADILAPLGLTSGTGYWGASSRAKARMLCDTQAPTTPSDPDDDDDDVSGDLRGGEADLGTLDTLNDPRNEEVSEGEEEVAVLGVEFDVDDADIEIRRVDVDFEATTLGTGDSSDEPWDYFEEIHLMDADMDVVASMNADDEDDWDEDGDVYQIRFTGLDIRVDEGDTAELYIAVTTRGVIDSDDEGTVWTVSIPNDGIRAIDGAGINQYTGEGNDSETFTIEEPEAGDLDISEADSNPNAAILVVEDDDNSDEYTVLVAEFEAGSADVLVEEITVNATSSDVDVALGDMIRTVTLVIDGEEFRSDEENDATTTGSYVFEDIDYVFEEDEEVEVAVVVEFLRTSGDFDGGQQVSFAIHEAGVEAEADASGEATDVEGDALGELHTLMLLGIFVEADEDDHSISVSNPDDESTTKGTYTLRFDVTAVGEDVYIYNVATSSNSGGDENDGVLFTVVGDTYNGTTSVNLSSTADVDGDGYLVEDGDTERFTLRVVLDPDAEGFYGIELDSILFGEDDDIDTAGDNVPAEIPNEPEFETDQEYINN